jgi:subtilisin family serine protease
MPRAGLWYAEGAAVEDALDVAQRMAQHPRVAEGAWEVWPDLWLPRARAEFQVPPNDPRYGGQWYFERVAMEDAWKLSAGAEEITIAIVDTGCELTHPDLTGKWVGGWDALDNDDDPSAPLVGPGANHGTACAGVASANTQNGEGIAGTCPLCTLSCVRLLGTGETLVPVSADALAFEKALEAKASVISNSWGFLEAIPAPLALRTAIEVAVNEGRDGLGAVVVFAVGNDDRTLADYEVVAVDGVIGVGATTNFDELTSFTNVGPSVDLVAPTATLTCDLSGAAGEDPGDYTGLFGGTSSACPLVAGVAGLLLAKVPNATAVDVARALVETAKQSPYATPDDSGHDLGYGYGLVQPAAALRWLSEEYGVAVDPVEPEADAGGEGPPADTSEADTGEGEAAAPDADAGESPQAQDGAAGASPGAAASGEGCGHRNPGEAAWAWMLAALGIAARWRARSAR